jgi:hypothetical protein
MHCALLATLLLAQAPTPAQPARELRVITGAQLAQALDAATPGTRILVAAGDYPRLYAKDVLGTAQHPIVLTAADPGSRPRFTAGVQLSDVAHLELENLVIECTNGNALNIDDADSFSTPSHHVVLRHLEVSAGGSRANHDAIKLSGVDDVRIEDCKIWRDQGGSLIDMVGCHRGVIERCTFNSTAEHGADAGVQAKGGSCDIAIRNSHFRFAGERAVNIGGSTGMAYFRPRPEGFEARNISVEGCVFMGSLSPIAFVGVDGASVRFNTFYRPEKWLVRILQETRAPEFVACRKGVFSDNLIAYDSSDVSVFVNIGPGTAPETFEFARNYWFCIDDPKRPPPTLAVAEIDARGGADPQFEDPSSGKFNLAADSPARAHGASAAARAKR